MSSPVLPDLPAVAEEVASMDIHEVLEQLKQDGKKLCRRSWNDAYITVDWHAGVRGVVAREGGKEGPWFPLSDDLHATDWTVYLEN